MSTIIVPFSAGASSTALYSGAAWTNATNALADDASDATASLTASQSTAGLRLSGATGIVPAGSTILGFQITVEASRGGSGTPVSLFARLANSGVAIGDQQTLSSGISDGKIVYTIGSEVDLMGAAVDADDINSGLELHLRLTNGSGISSATVAIDYATLTIAYSKLSIDRLSHDRLSRGRLSTGRLS